MLTIRREQMVQLNHAVLAQYQRRLAAALLEIYPSRFGELGMAAAESFVQHNVPRAEKYGIDSEMHVAEFVRFLLIHGAEFAERAEYAWALEILESAGEDGNAKMARLSGMLEALETPVRSAVAGS